MHALAVAEDEGPWPWYIKDQAEHTDLLTTHPYPYYTPHSHRDRISANRVLQFPAAQSALYSDIGGKPSLTQELSLLGPMIADERTSADYLASVLWSLWTVGDAGAVWWMAFDTRFIPETPYEWQAPEQELGCLTEHRRPKKVLGVMSAFKSALESLPKPIRRIGKHTADAVCLLAHSQENWTVAYSAFVMAKQAGFDIRFVHPDDPLPDADFYMIPSIKLVYHIPRSTWAAIMERVKAGAGLYLSFSSAFVARFKEISGIEVIQRQVRTLPIRMICGDSQLVIPNVGGDGREAPCKYDLRLAGGEVVCAEDDGSPLLVRHAVGKGTVYTLLSGLESAASNKPGALGDDPSSDYAVLYRTIFARLIERRNLVKRTYDKALALSEHDMGAGRVVVVGINHSGSPIHGTLGVGKAVRSIKAIRGAIHRSVDGLHYHLAPHDAFVAEIRKGR
jgi:hypothetical protein